MEYSIQRYLYNIASHKIQVDILQEDYAGAVDTLRIQSLKITHNWEDRQTPAIGTGCEFVVVNENVAWNFYEELLTAEEQTYKVKIYFSDLEYIYDYVIFEGFLVSEIQELQVLTYSTTTLKASNYIKQLENFEEVDAFLQVSTHSLITYIGQFLAKTGLSYNIYVACSLYETSMTNQRLMSDLILHKHLFQDGEDYWNILDSLNNVLRPFNMYVFSHNNRWYVERYSDMLNPDTAYEFNDVYYDVFDGTSFAYLSSSYYSFPILTAGVDFKYVRTTQTLRYGLGYCQVKLTCKEKGSHNLVNEYFEDATSQTQINDADFSVEKWHYTSSGSLSSNTAYDIVQFMPTVYELYYGIQTRIVVNGGSLKINYRRQFSDGELTILEASDQDFVKTSFRFGLFWTDKNSNRYVIRWDSNESKYVMERGYFYDYSVIHVLGDSYKYDKEGKYYYWELDESIDLSEWDSLIMESAAGLNTLELRIMACTYEYVIDGYPPSEIPPRAIHNPLYRNIRIVNTSTEEDVEIIGEIDANYSNKLDLEVDLFDTDRLFTANVMWVNSATLSNPVLSTEWLDSRTAAESAPRTLHLEEHYIEDVFQFYTKPRKTLVATIRYDQPLKPFSIIRDLHIQRDSEVLDMILLGYVWDVDTMEWEIEAEEFVRDDGYRVIEGEVVLPEEDSGEPEPSSGDFIPDPITDLALTQDFTSDGGVDASWSHVSGATGYRLYRKPTYISYNWQNIYSLVYEGGDNEYHDEVDEDGNVLETMKFYYKVCGYNEVGEGTYDTAAILYSPFE